MPAGPTYDLISNTTLTSTSTLVSFSSFSGYTDLVLVIRARAGTDQNVDVVFNNDQNSNYRLVQMYGDGSGGKGAGNGGSQTRVPIYGLADTSTSALGLAILHIFSYSNSTARKFFLSPSSVNATSAQIPFYAIARGFTWDNTSAITTIDCRPRNGSFAIGSSFTLYGITAA